MPLMTPIAMDRLVLKKQYKRGHIELRIREVNNPYQSFGAEYVKLTGQSYMLPPSQIIRHSKNLGESKHLKFDQIYMIR
jgi:hypothetical protein